MNKTIVKVFVILGILVLALLIWAFVFGNGLASIFNAIITPINSIYSTIVGGGTLIPQWNVATASDLKTASSQAFK